MHEFDYLKDPNVLAVTVGLYTGCIICYPSILFIIIFLKRPLLNILVLARTYT